MELQTAASTIVEKILSVTGTPVSEAVKNMCVENTMVLLVQYAGSQFTELELSILYLMSEGHSAKEIAAHETVCRSFKTVQYIQQDIKERLGCKTLPQLTKKIVKMKLIS